MLLSTWPFQYKKLGAEDLPYASEEVIPPCRLSMQRNINGQALTSYLTIMLTVFLESQTAHDSNTYSGSPALLISTVSERFIFAPISLRATS